MEHATLFAQYSALEIHYQKLLARYPHIFKYVEVHSRSAQHTDFYVPRSIADECKVYSLTFTEFGCRKVACFPQKQNLEECTEQDSPRYLHIGPHFYLACQPACHEISKIIDTEFRSGKCYRANISKKVFALFPEKVQNEKLKQPLHGGLTLRKGHLYINEDYCAAYGLSFHNDDCYSPGSQKVGEYFVGSTVYKSIKSAVIRKKHKRQPPPVPIEVSSMDHWLEGQQRKKKRAKRALPKIRKEHIPEIATEITKDFGIDISVDVTINLLKRHAPKTVMKLAQGIGDRVVLKHALGKIIVRSYATSLSHITKGLLSGLSRLNSALGILSLITSILDMFDPFNYNYVLDKKTVKRFDTRFHFAFFRTHKPVEITPDMVWNELENMDEFTETYYERMNYYLLALDLEDKHKRKLPPAPKPQPEEKKDDWQKIWHGLCVVTLIILSLCFLQYIAYFLLIYLVFIYFYPPSFY